MHYRMACCAGLDLGHGPAHSLEIADDTATLKIPLTASDGDNFVTGAA